MRQLSGDPADAREGPRGRSVAPGHRRSLVDRGRRPVHAIAHGESDGRAPAHGREPAPVPLEARRCEPPPQPRPEAVAALPHRTQAALLDALEESIYTQPPTDWSKVTNLGQMRAVPEVKNTVNLAQQYADLGYDPNALITRLATIVVHDNFTEMHAFKHHQATFEEFHATRLPWRWRHLVSAAQASAISYGKNLEVYEEAIELLHA